MGAVIKTPVLYFLAFLCGGGITTLGVRFMPLKHWTPESRRRIRRFMPPPEFRHVRAESLPRRAHATPAPNRAHSGSQGETRRVLRVGGDDVFGNGIIDTIDPFRQISRSPLLLRKDTVMPFRLRASTLLRIRWKKLLGVSPSAPAGSIFSNSTFWQGR